MSIKMISIIKDFSKSPYGRYPSDGDWNGQAFRTKILTPALRNSDKVVVDLTGYNRYGRSFIDEAFGGLIREDGFTKEELDSKLEYNHNDLKSFELLITERIEKADYDTRNSK
ncbi:STAS-like domain-containing protein [Pantoea eucrina]|uniref:STAS-like domain-containing protein n=2 Tax=Pantoea eucrina TaxID=472693 RepID=A0ABS1Z8X8_9GAMM|nr:STAS-like domain-containing protein [Pantoea eucrina]